jgi:hypothetical protein
MAQPDFHPCAALTVITGTIGAIRFNGRLNLVKAIRKNDRCDLPAGGLQGMENTSEVWNGCAIDRSRLGASRCAENWEKC